MIYWKRIHKIADIDEREFFRETFGLNAPVVSQSYHCDDRRPLSYFPGHNIEITKEEYEQGLRDEEAYSKKLDELKAAQSKKNCRVRVDEIEEERKQGTAKEFRTLNDILDHYKHMED